MTTAAADLIVYDQALGSQRQLHAIGHQLGHLLLGRQGTTTASPYSRA